MGGGGMSKIFGAAALACSILTIFAPGVSISASIAAIVLAIFAALAGDRMFASATSIVVAINAFFLSLPIWIILGSYGPYRVDLLVILLIGLAAPFAAMYLETTLRRRRLSAS
jgi:hypothetical protein